MTMLVAPTARAATNGRLLPHQLCKSRLVQTQAVQIDLKALAAIQPHTIKTSGVSIKFEVGSWFE